LKGISKSEPEGGVRESPDRQLKTAEEEALMTDNTFQPPSPPDGPTKGPVSVVQIDALNASRPRPEI
jgi:hypothetical protein